MIRPRPEADALARAVPHNMLVHRTTEAEIRLKEQLRELHAPPPRSSASPPITAPPRAQETVMNATEQLVQRAVQRGAISPATAASFRQLAQLDPRRAEQFIAEKAGTWRTGDTPAGRAAPASTAAPAEPTYQLAATGVTGTRTEALAAVAGNAQALDAGLELARKMGAKGTREQIEERVLAAAGLRPVEQAAGFAAVAAEGRELGLDVDRIVRMLGGGKRGQEALVRQWSRLKAQHLGR